MSTSPAKSASLSGRLRIVANVDQNIKAARQKALDHQNLIEKLAKPLNVVSEKLAKLEHAQASVSVAGERKIESLTEGLEKKIAKLKEDTAAKIEQTKAETKAKIEALQSEQSSSENKLMIEYAEAIAQFSLGGSPSDLATVLGVSQKEAKNLIESSKSELDKAGISVASPTGAMSAAEEENENSEAAKADAGTVDASA